MPTNILVHSYENEYPTDILPRGRFPGTWSGHYVVLEATGAYVPTDVGVQGSVKVVLEVTDERISVLLDLV